MGASVSADESLVCERVSAALSVQRHLGVAVDVLQGGSRRHRDILLQFHRRPLRRIVAKHFGIDHLDVWPVLVFLLALVLRILLELLRNRLNGRRGLDRSISLRNGHLGRSDDLVVVPDLHRI